MNIKYSFDVVKPILDIFTDAVDQYQYGVKKEVADPSHNQIDFCFAQFIIRQFLLEPFSNSSQISKNRATEKT